MPNHALIRERQLPTKQPATRARIIVLACIAGASIAVWLTWPSTGQIKVDTCSPNSILAEISAMTHGKGFWRVQLDDIGRQRNAADNWDQNQTKIEAEIDEAIAKGNAQVEELYQKYPTLAPSQPSQADRMTEQLRAQADAIEIANVKRMASEQMQKRLPLLRQCETKIREMLN
jgi:hypothetical protein